MALDVFLDFLLSAPLGYLLRIMQLDRRTLRRRDKYARRDILQVRRSITLIYKKFKSFVVFKFLLHYNKDFVKKEYRYSTLRAAFEKKEWYRVTEKANLFIPNIYAFCNEFDDFFLLTFYYYTDRRSRADYLRANAGFSSDNLAFTRVVNDLTLEYLDPKNMQRWGLSMLVSLYASMLFTSPYSILFQNLTIHSESK